MSQGKNILNFFELIDNQKKIEIPIIQRDYAQGREDKKKLEIISLMHYKKAFQTIGKFNWTLSMEVK